MRAAFASALQEYREALAASAEELSAPNQQQLYQLHMDTLMDIEQRFAETSDPSMCRLLVESARIVHTANSFAGPNGQRLRQAIQRLVDEVTPNDT